MMVDRNENHSAAELIEFIIEKQRIELVRIAERHDYNFQDKEVIAASIEMDYWLNLHQQSKLLERDITRGSKV